MITPSFGLTATERVLPRLALDWTTGSSQSGVDVTRAGVATFVGSNGLVQNASADTQRIDYSTGVAGLLVEESRTNLLSYSSDFSDASWNTKTNITLTGGIDDPAGGTDAFTLTATADGGVLQKAVGVTSGVALTGSIFIRRRTGSGSVLMRVGDLTTVTIPVTSSWARVPVTRTPSSGTGRFAIQLATSGDAVDIWGAQLEAGAFPTSYIPTEATAVTRNADVATMTGTNFSSWYNQTAGTFILTAITNVVGSPNFPRFFHVRGATTGDSISALQFRAAGQFGANVRVGAVSQGDITINGLVAGTEFKGAVAYAANDLAISFNASAVVVDNTVNLPTVDTLDFSNVGGTSQAISGYIKKLNYYPMRLSNAELQSFTK